MKRFLIVPSLVLAVLLALCILNAAALNRRTNRWMDQADRIAQLAEQERWDMAREAMDALSAQILESQSLEGLEYPASSQYTSMALMNAIKTAVAKAALPKEAP